MEEVTQNTPRKKRPFLIGTSVLLILATLGTTIWFARALRQHSATASTVDSLSARSKEFLESQKQNEASNWNFVDVDSARSTPTPNSHEARTTCFTATIPTSVQRPKVEENPSKCTFFATLPSPSSKITITVENRPQPLSSNSNVILRQRKTEEYQQLLFQHQLYREALQFESADSLSTFILHEGKTITLVFSNIAKLDDRYTDLTNEIIDSLQLLDI